MADTPKSSTGPEIGKQDARKRRQAEALRANLRKRKEQKRGRDEAQEDELAETAPPPSPERNDED